MTDSVRSIPEYVEKLLRQQLEQKDELIQLLKEVEAQKISIYDDMINYHRNIITALLNK